MDVWGYARVSTDEQADDEGALIKQMRRLRSAGATKLYYDVESRTSDKRKGLLRLIEDIHSLIPGKVSKLLFIRIDRLTSSSMTFYRLMDALKKKGIEPTAIDEPFDISSIGGELTIDVRLAASKYEVKMLGMRVKKERDTRKTNQKAHWNAPLGYQVENDKYKRDDRPCVCIIEGQVELTRDRLMRLVFDTFFAVGSVSQTVRKLHDILGIQANAIPKSRNDKVNILAEENEVIFANINKSRGSSLNLRYPHTSLKWSVSGLRSILVNPIYAGGTPYNTVVHSNGHRKPFDEWEVVWGTHEDEAIITREEHERIKTMIRGNRNNRWASEQKYTNPFANLVKCDRCGAAYSRQCKKLVKKKNFIRHHYQCSFYRTGACSNKQMISSDNLEKQVIEHLVKEAEKLAGLAEQETQVMQESPEVKTLRASLNTLEALPSNRAIEKAKEEIIIQIADARSATSNNSQLYLIAKERIIQAFSNPKFWQGLQVEDKKALLQGCIKKIVVDGNRVTKVELLHLPS
ncbi:fdxN element excision recombinase XisF [Rivularia sp. UHCC 0363]|uniref:fdxN element excision recombinase XisF n=1 Tax=Rivularia sp. UHCC 0363 TaxID=3110244 RepID=UPI002B20FD4E|nr:fdxN element excision recombinase XisF [Rivularia sp. UHCC 0363]MEA5599145.1 fdxN element excision recombinase XisF [Rivularia sp. UHCC 0363]